MINRDLSAKALQLSRKFKLLALIGPRQSGKTTLARSLFKNKKYVSLENLQNRNFASTDPQAFLEQHHKGAILDEIQKVPELFSYLQQVADESRKKGLFILTGSQNFLLQQSISQSLAGRVAYLTLLPFSKQELKETSFAEQSLEDWIYKGSYPPIYDQRLHPGDWYSNYIKTYLERDVRQMKNIANLKTFDRFLRMCAARTGQLLNQSSLSIDVGVDQKTIQSWLGILEASFIIHLMPPYFENFNKRITKSPKLYFIDTGLACSLLGIKSKEQIQHHYLKGALFETWVVAELLKSICNKGIHTQLYFWRDKTGNETDILIDSGKGLMPVEIKSGKTIHDEFFKGIRYFRKTSLVNNKAFVVYGGTSIQKRSENIEVISWKDVAMIV